MERKHTPGPWSRDWIYGGIRHLNKNVDYDAFCDSETLAKIDAGELDYPNVRINPADADLIAAAPDLADALEAFADEPLSTETPGVALDYDGDARILAARIALRKAGRLP